ncbi:PREDICTED: ATP-dependent DNA helicase Q4 [Cyphomyrmex costatus]|uniref:DNA 3'-5' helicase n=1 Tax=Cyphomyrmex costatus TaxID=456900 RepID=A0A195BYY3_9HYME|nr:PREDICTED: ATP-dependent DNA helicase Q4 [Cyphomyrmex costatus]XP_018405757.1 PREDICTED: ATP-dependent DNA helicase Q4 [Cyphomyrmex costatus]KYM93535.1 ATP-dependent DNA helicase Q4 [Cyphomyrmex costatus]
MNLFEDPILKTKYLKHKLCVKRWESNFMERFGRKPNKNDIKEADPSIKDAYKMYWKLKTRALEETLTDITFCDDMQDNISNKSPQKIINNHKQDKNLSSEKVTKDTENINPYDSKRLTEIGDSFDQLDSVNVEGTWGNHLNKNNEQTSKKKPTLLIGRSSSFQLSRNKFESSTFTKRNPRKSLSLVKMRNRSENILSTSNIDQLDAHKDVAIDETKPIVESMKVTFEKSKPALQHSINVVQQLANGHVNSTSRNLNPGWLHRCTRDNNLEVTTINPQRLSGTSDSGIESMESSIYSPNDLAPIVHFSSHQASDEDFICNSESEEEHGNKRIRNFKKRLSDQDSHPVKRRRIHNDSDFTIGEFHVTNSDMSKLTTCIDRSFNLLNRDEHSENNVDNDNAFKLTNNANTSTNIINESINIKSDIITLDSNIESNVIIKNKMTSENVCSTENDQTKELFRMTDSISNSTNLNNQKDFSKSDEKPVKRVLRQRVTQVSNNCDPSIDNNEEPKTMTKTNKKFRSQRSKEKTIVNEKKSNVKRKSSRRELNLEKNNEELSLDEKMNKIPTYNVEMLQTIPRFNKPNDIDNLSQFSETVSTNAMKKDVSISSTARTKLTAKEKLEKKMTAGTMNNNFIRINLKKKVFVRGKKNFNCAKYKRNQWKQRKKDLTSSESNLDAADFIDKNGTACLKCGESGHFAKNCSTSKSSALLPLEEIDDSSNFPTLEEAEKMANETAIITHSHKRFPKRSSYFATKTSQDEEDMTELFNDDFADFDEKSDTLTSRHKVPQELVFRLLPPEMKAIDPLYDVNEDNSLIETPTEIFETLRMFGHESFRVGQEKTIMRILSGQSTLVTLSTGSGKSLCYQLPAYLYAQRSVCITLVISPLVSLMDDQVTGVPLFLSAACLHANQTVKVREQVIQSLKDGKVNILLISPETMINSEKSTDFGALLRQLPPIAFVCIDEAHCISQWSYNFRPSYLMVCRVLKEKFKVKTILGLTATATKTTVESMIKHLDIHDGIAGVISDVPLPRNLVLTVSKDENKDQALIALLRSERFRECHSVIVYCIRREECMRIAGLLRISLQDPRNPEKPNMKISAIAEVYHAGMTSNRRKLVQKNFMDGKIKIVVATIAFGMGINKSDIRAIIHYNMPGTFEGYVQEVGRAGRDNITAHCHLFLNPMEDSDKWELRRHVHANGVDRHTIRHLLQRIFIPCSCAKINEKNLGQRCPGHEVALPIDETVHALDITQEVILTLLCYLELHPKRFITVLPSVYIQARISSYEGPHALKQAAQSSPPLAMALDMKNGISNENIIEFPVIDVASAIGWDSGVVKSHLKTLEWKTGVDGKMKRSAISVEYHKLGLRMKAPGDLSDIELDEALDALITRTQTQESLCLQQLELASSAFNKISVSSIKHSLVLDDNVTKRSEELKNTIRDYFLSDSPLSDLNISLQNKVTNEQQIAVDVRSLIICYKDTKFTGRVVARIFHGIQSPNYPALIWHKCRFWRIHIATDFNTICKIAAREILALR